MESIKGFLKVGNKAHLEAFRNGLVYCNTLQFFKELETIFPGMGDKYEGVGRVEQFDELSVKKDGIYVPVLKNGIAVWDRGQYRGNIFCTYLIDIPVAEVERSDAYPLNINSSVVGFGDSFIIVSDINEFVRRFTKAVELTGDKLSHGSIEYIDFKNYTGDVTPFNKQIKFNDQFEHRFYIDRVAISANDSCCYELGDLSNIISEVYDADSISTLTFFKNNIPV